MAFGKDILNAVSSGFTGGLSSLAGSLGSAVSGGLNQLFAGIQAKRDHEYFLKRADVQQQMEHETMDKQQQMAIDFWKMQNEYNDPSAVADRYRNAGINPLNAFEGSVVGLGASSAPLPHAGTGYGSGSGLGSSGGIVDPSSVALAGAGIKEKLEGLDIDRENVRGLNLLRQTEAKLNDAKSLVSDQEWKNLKQTYDFLQKKQPIELDEARQNLENLRSVQREIESRIDLNDQEKKNKEEALEGIRIANAIASLQYAILKETGLKRANAEIAQIYANTRALNSEADYKDSLADKVYIETLAIPVELNLEKIRTFTSVASAFSDIKVDNANIKSIEAKIANIKFENSIKAVHAFLDAWDTILNEKWDRDNSSEQRSEDRDQRSKDNDKRMLSGLLQAALFVMTKGK